MSNRLESLQRKFLWNRSGDAVKFHLVDRNTIFYPIVLGRGGGGEIWGCINRELLIELY